LRQLSISSTPLVPRCVASAHIAPPRVQHHYSCRQPCRSREENSVLRQRRVNLRMAAFDCAIIANRESRYAHIDGEIKSDARDNRKSCPDTLPGMGGHSQRLAHDRRITQYPRLRPEQIRKSRSPIGPTGLAHNYAANTARNSWPGRSGQGGGQYNPGQFPHLVHPLDN